MLNKIISVGCNVYLSKIEQSKGPLVGSLNIFDSIIKLNEPSSLWFHIESDNLGTYLKQVSYNLVNISVWWESSINNTS